MPATLSAEGRIETRLRELHCAGRNFVDIAKTLGVRIAHGPFSEALTGKKPFDHQTANELLEILDRMKCLQQEVDVPVDWARTEKVSNALTVRLVSQVLTCQSPEKVAKNFPAQ